MKSLNVSVSTLIPTKVDNLPNMTVFTLRTWNSIFLKLDKGVVYALPNYWNDGSVSRPFQMEQRVLDMSDIDQVFGQLDLRVK